MGTQGEGGDGGPGSGGPDTKKDDIYDNRPGSKKIIRVVTVMAYMVSVSFVAIVLSAYYVFLWQPPNPRLMHRSHLRGDPKVDYLVHRPPTEVTLNESLSGIDIRDKVNAFREEIIRNRGINVSIENREDPDRSINLNISRTNSINSMDEAKRNDSRISAGSWNPIYRAFLATTEISRNEESGGNSSGVYDSVDAVTKSSLDTESLDASTLFMATREINETTTIPSSSSSPRTLTEGKDNLYNSSINDFSSTSTINASFDINESNRSSNYSNEKLGTTLDRDEVTPSMAYELIENSTNIEVDQSTISVEATNVGKSNYTDTQSKTVQTIPTLTEQRDSERKALQFTVQPTKLGSHITRASTKNPTNETETLEKFSSSLQANEEIPIEIVPGSAGYAGSVSKSSGSMVPAVVQPESEFVKKDQESKEQSTQDSDFGFI